MQNSWKFILDNLKKDVEVKESFKPNDNVLIIDSMNTFLRCFAIINHVNPSGNHTGGLTGFLKSIGYAIRLIEPTKVVLVFDGQGGSTNKRYLYPEYKANRNIQQIKNWNFETREEESEAIVSQLIRLVDYLKCLPVHMLSVDKIEADDVIGHLCNKFEGKVTIMSADKDFLQLVDDKRIQVYNPTEKKFYRTKEVYEKFGVYPYNFILYKTYLGDKGDNVPKIKGFGDDKLFKLIPELKETKKLTLQESFDMMREDSKWKEKITAFKNQLDINYKLMDLKNPNIPDSDLETINFVVSNSNKTFDRDSFIQMYKEDLLGDSIKNVDTWLIDNFRHLTAF
jgi:DNA polymerase-1